ncbi:MAG: hypothetical protein JXB42_08250 [Deltaproteobacteria bacterium]|nr:hypothetical protein [Deltaproteobacteria bacterium]
MITYHWKNVHIEITETRILQRHEDKYGTGRDIFVRNVEVGIWFWKYYVKGLTRLVFIKSVLQAFLHNRMGDIPAEDFVIEFLRLKRTQKDGKQFVKFELCGIDGSIDEEEYFNYQEVAMLDIALGKALNFLSP